MKNLYKIFLSELSKFRKQGLEVSDINPISALADKIYDKLYTGKIAKKDISYTLEKISENLWKEQIINLRKKTNLTKNKINIDLKNIEISEPVYQAVFTAHPVFRFSKKLALEIGNNASNKIISKPKSFAAIRNNISLDEEHNEAISAMLNARHAINDINYEIIKKSKKLDKNWKEKLPAMLGISTWVGYDLDGRSDINWRTSFILRLKEKNIIRVLFKTTFCFQN